MFEINDRHLGGLLAAFSHSHEPTLLAKAIELGDMVCQKLTERRKPQQKLEHLEDGSLSHSPSSFPWNCLLRAAFDLARFSRHDNIRLDHVIVLHTVRNAMEAVLSLSRILNDVGVAEAGAPLLFAIDQPCVQLFCRDRGFVQEDREGLDREVLERVKRLWSPFARST